MPSIVIPRASGALRAILAYDRSLRVRWSWERRCWAIEAKVLRPELMAPPVRFIPIPGTQLAREQLLPELSDKNICYRHKTSILAFTPVVDMRAFEVVVDSDGQRSRRSLSQRVEDVEAFRTVEFARQRKERAREARKFLNWSHNRTPMSSL